MSGPVSPPLTVREADGSPSGRPINTIVVSNGDLSISGTTATIDTSGSGTIGGTIADTQVAFGSAADTITGSSKFRYLESEGQLILTGVNDDNAEFVIERSSGSTQRIGIENDSSASPKLTVSGPPNNMKPLMLENHVTDTAVTGGNQGFIFNVSNTSDQSISMINILTTDSSAYDVVFNEDSLNDYDVRIEGATDPNLFVADGSQDAIGIGTFPAAGVKLHIKDAESDNDNVVIRIQDDSADTIGDQIAIEGFYNSVEAGRIFWELRDVGDGGSAFVIDVFDGTNLMEFIRMDGATGAITFNEQSEDIDFRVETNNNDSTLRIVGSTDNVGIQCIPDSSVQLEVKNSISPGSSSIIRISNSNTSMPNDTKYGAIEFFNADASGAGVGAEIRALSNGSGRGGQLDFLVGSSGGSQSSKMFIDESGVVTIGSNASSTVLGIATLQIPDNTISHYANVNTIRSDAVSLMVMVNEDNQGQMWVHDSSSAHTIQLVEGGVKGMHFQFMSTDGGITIDPQGSDTLNGGTASLSRNTNFEIYDVFCYANGKWALSNPA